jgi:hypothetical protein
MHDSMYSGDEYRGNDVLTRLIHSHLSSLCDVLSSLLKDRSFQLAMVVSSSLLALVGECLRSSHSLLPAPRIVLTHDSSDLLFTSFSVSALNDNPLISSSNDQSLLIFTMRASHLVLLPLAVSTAAPVFAAPLLYVVIFTSVQ